MMLQRFHIQYFGQPSLRGNWLIGRISKFDKNCLSNRNKQAYQILLRGIHSIYYTSDILRYRNKKWVDKYFFQNYKVMVKPNTVGNS